ncbi:Transcription Cofactor Hes-6 [Manis pentadactyla]|nr:Transcription Cofactor Hes-6 [Manis pentadactyla]
MRSHAPPTSIPPQRPFQEMSLPEDKHHWDSRKDEVPRKFLDQKETRVEWVTLNDNTDDKENGNGTSDVEDVEL